MLLTSGRNYVTVLRSTLNAILLSVFLVIVCAGHLFGQNTGTITGSITDSSGAVVPGATVTIVGTETNSRRVVPTDSGGRYSSGPLPVGSYRVEVQASGFKNLVQAGVNLSVQQTAVIDGQLEVGSTTEQMTVTATAPLVNTSDASQGQVIDSLRVEALPLNGRDYLQLALLSEGALEGPGADRSATGANNGTTSRAGGFSAGGQRTTDNNYLLNGFNNLVNDASMDANQADLIKPSVDAIEEFKVQTNGYSAEFGRAGGGIVNLTLKSGTNRFHGTAYEFFRNEKLDARNFFVPGKTPPFKRNDYGFTVGGPVIKDKMFFFFAWEKLERRESSTFNNTIPTVAMRAGDFSGLSTIIYDPTTYDPATNTRKPFPGNMIPSSRIDPIAAQVINFYPTPQNAKLSQNYIYVPPFGDTLPKWTTNEDYQVSPNSRISFMFNRQYDFQPGSNVQTLPSPAFGGGSRQQAILAYNTGLTWVSTISPTLVTSTKVGWAYDRFDIGYPPEVFALGNVNQKIGLQIPPPTVAEPFSQFVMNGYSTIGPGTNLPYYSVGQDRELRNDTSWVRGAHTLQFGADVQWIQTYNYNARYQLGIFTFTGRYTRNPATTSGGSSVADFLLGNVDNSTISTATRLDERATLAAGYFQDNWKVSPRLTLNLGLRYSYFRPFEAKYNNVANVDLWTNPQQPQIVLSNQVSPDQFWQSSTTNFQPRLGVAYQLLPEKLVLRAGYGIYYPDVRFTPFGDSSSLVVNPPYNVSVTTSSNGITPSSLLQNGLPPDAVTLSSTTPISLGSTQTNGHWPYVQQFNFNLQYQLAKGWMAQVGFFGTKATNLANLIDANYVPVLGPGSTNQLRRFKSIFVPSTSGGAGITVSPIGAILATVYEGNLIWDSLQAKIEHQFSAGFSIIGSWVWSKGLTDTRGNNPMGAAPGATFQNPANLRPERGLIDPNLAHRLVISGIWDLPYGRSRKYGSNLNRFLNILVGDWSLQAIETFTTGHPFTVTSSIDNANSGQTNRPDLIGDWRTVPGGQTLQRWFNTAAFARNEPYTFGNLGRNNLIGPNYQNVDCSLVKEGTLFTMKDQPWRLQFRWEFFNVMNHPNFQFPGSTLGTPTFGQITAADPPRLMQVAMKIVF